MVLAWAGYDPIVTSARIPGAYPLAREPRGMDEEHPLPSPVPAPAGDGDTDPMVPDRSADRPAILEHTGGLERVERWSA